MTGFDTLAATDGGLGLPWHMGAAILLMPLAGPVRLQGARLRRRRSPHRRRGAAQVAGRDGRTAIDRATAGIAAVCATSRLMAARMRPAEARRRFGIVLDDVVANAWTLLLWMLGVHCHETRRRRRLEG